MDRFLRLAIPTMFAGIALALLYAVFSASSKGSNRDPVAKLAVGAMVKLDTSDRGAPAATAPFVDASGAEVTLQDFEGQAILINFWATWCGPCVAAVPKLADLQEKHEDDLVVVGVSGLNDGQNAVESFLKKKNEPFVQLYDPEMKVFNEFNSTGIPLVLVVSTDGVIRWMGNPHDRAFKSAVEKVIKADPMIQAKG